MRSAVAGLTMAILGAGAAAAAGEASLAGAWRIDSVRGAAAFDASKTEFEVAADGRVAATVGCNRIAGKPTVEGERVTFGPMAATRMACPPPLDALEAKFLDALTAARTWRIDGARLTLLNDRGEAEISMTRAAD